MILSVAARYQKSANEACRKLFGPGAEGTFTTPLYDKAGAVARYWCGWALLTDEQYKALDSECPNIVRHEGGADEVLAALGLSAYLPTGGLGK